VIRKLAIPIIFALGLTLGGQATHTFAGDCTKSQDPKCDVPEAPKPLGLPIAGAAVFGGYVWYLRRRQDTVEEVS
jgi:hypothetical protein